MSKTPNLLSMDEREQMTNFAIKEKLQSQGRILSRKYLLEIVHEHNQLRKTPLIKKIVEEAKIIAQYQKENKKIKEDKLREFIKRISNAKKNTLEINRNSIKGKLKFDIHRKKSDDVIMNEDDNTKIVLNRKTDIINNLHDKCLYNYNNKMKRFEKSLERLNGVKTLKMELSKERRDKHILRSKIQNILSSLRQKSCVRFYKAYQRLNDILKKDRVQYSSSLKGCEQYYSDDELEQINKENKDFSSILIRSLSLDEIESVIHVITLNR